MVMPSESAAAAQPNAEPCRGRNGVAGDREKRDGDHDAEETVKQQRAVDVDTEGHRDEHEQVTAANVDKLDSKPFSSFGRPGAISCRALRTISSAFREMRAFRLARCWALRAQAALMHTAPPAMAVERLELLQQAGAL